MSVSHVTSGSAFANSGTGVSSAAFNMTAGGCLIVMAKAAEGFVLSGISDTAGSTFVALPTYAVTSHGQEKAWYVLSTAAQTNNVITVTTTGSGSAAEVINWGHYTTTASAFEFDTHEKYQGPRVSGAYTCPSMNTLRAGVVFMGYADTFAGSGLFSGYSPFAMRAESHVSVGRAALDYITTSAQTGLVASIVAVDGIGQLYTVSLVEAAAAAALDETDWFIREPQGQPLTISVW